MFYIFFIFLFIFSVFFISNLIKMKSAKDEIVEESSILQSEPSETVRQLLCLLMNYLISNGLFPFILK